MRQLERPGAKKCEHQPPLKVTADGRYGLLASEKRRNYSDAWGHSL